MASDEDDKRVNSEPFKRLKSIPPDLNVVLSYKDKMGEEKKESVEMYSQILCWDSDFVDTCFKNQMAESKNKEISFKVQPEVFRVAMECLRDLTKIEDLLSQRKYILFFEVVLFYKEYLFDIGLRKCQCAMQKHLENCVYVWELQEYDGPPDDFEAMKLAQMDLNWIVDTLVFCYENSLDDAYHDACDLIKRGLIWANWRKKAYNHLLFTEEQIRKLQPYIADLKFRGTNSLLPTGYCELTEEEYFSSLFPKLYVTAWSEHYSREIGVSDIEVSGSYIPHLDGRYFYSPGVGFYVAEDEDTGVPVFCIMKDRNTKEWTIFLATKILKDMYFNGNSPVAYYRCPGSSNHKIPPTSPWEKLIINHGESPSDLYIELKYVNHRKDH